MNILNELKNSVPIAEVVTRLGLNLPTQSANSLLGNCPTGHPSQSGQCFGVNLNENYFHCFSCGEAGDIFKLVELVKKCDFKSALQWLVDEFRPDLKADLGKEQLQLAPQKKEYFQRADLFRLIYAYGKELLYTPVATQELQYLVNDRKYDLEALKKTDWIYFPPDQEIKSYLLQRHPEAAVQIKELKLQGHYGDNFRLAFPYRDSHGSITAYIKRSASPKGVTVTTWDSKKYEGVRYDSTPGSGTKHDLFNLCNCKGKDTLLIVEGYPDALYFKTLRLDNVVAVGQGLLSKTHLVALEEFGVKNVIISFDNDPPKVDSKTGKEIITGVENTDKALNLLAGTKIKPYVLPPHWLTPYKDPDEYVKAHGVEAFKDLIKNSITGAKWHAHRLLGRHDIHTDLGRGNAAQEAFNVALGLRHIDRENYLEIIGKELNFTQEYIDEELAALHRRNEEERIKKEYHDFFQKGVEYSQAGDAEKIKQLMQQNKNLEMKNLHSTVPIYSMDEFIQDIRNSPEGLKTGYQRLDAKLVIPIDAMTIIAGRPSHGKTTLMLNMCLNMVEMYPEKSFLFFTYEEPIKHLVLKMLNILGDQVIDQRNNQIMLTRYLLGGHTHRKPIEKAKARLDEYLSQGRLRIVDERKTAGQLYETLQQFSEEHEIGAVFIDYIQKIPSGNQFGTRQLELQNISGQILETATSLHIPIILGAQLNREHSKNEPGRLKLENLREAGDIEQDANLVMAIYNEAMDKMTTDSVDTSDGGCSKFRVS
ncbi:MAG: DnaB-like helicase C-terminal domain-containing protein [Desulfosporosinus sp.]|nr:DnaB-like helicase C-terminal domain-containing protein [Desulfosporosinus sp.]